MDKTTVTTRSNDHDGWGSDIDMSDTDLLQEANQTIDNAVEKNHQKSHCIACNMRFRSLKGAKATALFAQTSILDFLTYCKQRWDWFYQSHSLLADATIADLADMSPAEFLDNISFSKSSNGPYELIHVTLKLTAPFHFSGFKSRLLPFLQEHHIWMNKNTTVASTEELIDVSYIFCVNPRGADLNYLRTKLNEVLSHCYNEKDDSFQAQYPIQDFDSTISTTTRYLKSGNELLRTSVLTVQSPKSQATITSKLFPEAFSKVFQRYRIGEGLSGIYQVPAKFATHRASRQQRLQYQQMFHFHRTEFLRKHQQFLIQNLPPSVLSQNLLQPLFKVAPFVQGIDSSRIHDADTDNDTPRTWKVTVFHSSTEMTDLVSRSMEATKQVLEKFPFPSSIHPIVAATIPDTSANTPLAHFCKSQPSVNKWKRPPTIMSPRQPLAQPKLASPEPPPVASSKKASSHLDPESIQKMMEKVVSDLLEPLKQLVSPPTISKEIQDQLAQLTDKLDTAEKLISKQSQIIDDQNQRLDDLTRKNNKLAKSLKEHKTTRTAEYNSFMNGFTGKNKALQEKLDISERQIQKLETERDYFSFCTENQCVNNQETYDWFLALKSDPANKLSPSIHPSPKRYKKADSPPSP